MRHVLRRFAIAVMLIGVASLCAGWLWLAQLQKERTNSELIRYAQLRLQGHDRLEFLATPILQLAQRQVERPLSSGELPTLGKGQQSLPPPGPSADSRPDSVAAIEQAIRSARAGQTIEIAPGTYRFERILLTGNAGTSQQPIILRAPRPGSVILEIAGSEGLLVSQPYWIVENLDWRGVCTQDAQCEHAIHIIGKAAHAIVRNNRLQDFNAQIKVNGHAGDWPDHGQISFNTLSNSRSRATRQPVTPIDIVGASHWQVSDNLISHFVKGEGDRISYGIFMKGGGENGRIERNLIVCTPRDISQPGVRVGLSFGGGGTGQNFCRDGRCEAEHSGGIASQNIIAHCNDFGIDMNRARHASIAFNTLINTSGIDARNGSSAKVYGNLLEGRIRARDSSEISQSMNESGKLADYLEAPDQLLPRWRKLPESIPSLPALGKDFCHSPRRDGTLPGALDSENSCQSK